ncbi:hypothetical protein N7495_007460 [Penicillium taxi]|uniref:uncharacterized protein n=1 Tax=Penicillium taxi TaxID=168475 RepID=UPI0025457E3E|nr:uncharacterized protein N7495_007460 [Penicillium taxi]KAJ5887419.1 hypothetical protein N7495_007460 [Penicillium taxi]
MDTEDGRVPDHPSPEPTFEPVIEQEQSVSEQSVSEQSAPEQSAPEQSAPEQSAPAAQQHTPQQPEPEAPSFDKTALLNHIAALKSRIASLTGNPGVIATFFMSARDGAIIYTDWDRAPVADRNAADVNGVADSGSGSYHSFPEAMASEIFAYVTSATRFSQSFTRPILAFHDEAFPAESIPREEDRVGLLRMRTQSSEVIIFPTSNYIMCVLNKITVKERATKTTNGPGPIHVTRVSTADPADLVRGLSVQDPTS